MRTEADVENPEGRDELKYLEEYISSRAPRRKIERSSARDTDDGGVTPRGPIAIVGCD